MNDDGHNLLEDRKLKEIEHSDRRRKIVTGFEYSTDTAQSKGKTHFVTDDNEYKLHFSNMKFYSITRTSFAYRDSILYKDIEGKTALDYCCGNGEIATEMAKRGAARVDGIDISEVAINNAKKLAKEYGVVKKCNFQIMDAENTTFEESHFDLIHEYGALHHLELDSSLKELSRILKPQGKIVCTEALRHNPFIHYYRHKTPHLRTQWEYEHILGVPEIMSARRYFDEINIRFFHIAVLGAVPFRKTFFFNSILSIFEFFDIFLLRIPYLQKMAWVSVIEYKAPKLS